MLRPPYKIGITGGIGSGKSVVSRLLRLMDVPVYDCDSMAKRLMHENCSIREALISTVGDNVYDATGQLNRAYLASYIFGDANRVAAINRIVHPVVRADFKQWVWHTGKAIVAIESAILFEANMDGDVDTVWLIHAPEEIRLRRAMYRDASDEKAVRNRMKNQLSEQEYMDRADHIVYNDNNHSLIKQVKDLLHTISIE